MAAGQHAPFGMIGSRRRGSSMARSMAKPSGNTSTRSSSDPRPSDIVVMDNLGSHRSSTVRQAFRAPGAKRFSPKYSLDLSPIEMLFAKLKTVCGKPPNILNRQSMTPSSFSLLSHQPNAPTTSHTQDMLEFSASCQSQRLRRATGVAHSSSRLTSGVLLVNPPIRGSLPLTWNGTQRESQGRTGRKIAYFDRFCVATMEQASLVALSGILHVPLVVTVCGGVALPAARLPIEGSRDAYRHGWFRLRRACIGSLSCSIRTRRDLHRQSCRQGRPAAQG